MKQLLWRMICLLLLSLSAGTMNAQEPRSVTPTNRLFLFTKPAVVRIYSGYLGQWQWDGRLWNTMAVSSGSGSLIHPNGYILTNAHVVSEIKEGDAAGRRTLLIQLGIQALKAKGLAINQESLVRAVQVLSNNANLTQFKRVNYVVMQSGRHYIFEIKSYGAPSGQGQDLATGKDVAVLKIEVKNAPTLKLGSSEEVQVGDRIFVMGYPGAADSNLLDAKSALEPTINDGAISAKKTSADGAPILQTNTNATHGNSGGPAINEKGEVIGLLTFRGNTVNNQEVQGFNFIVPTSTALEFVRQAGTENQVSPLDVKWQKGLELFWNREYKNARSDFQEVLALFSDHAEATKLIAECQERISKGEDRSGLAALKILALVGCSGLLLLAGLILLLVVVFRKGKKRTPQASPQWPGPQPLQGKAPSQLGPIPAPLHEMPQRPSPTRTEAFHPSERVIRLVCTAGPLMGQEFPIGPGLTIGRDPTRAQLVVPDTQVSSQHLWVGLVNGRILARDNGSTNGTYLNGNFTQRITEVELHDRDVLYLGLNQNVAFRIAK